MRLIVGGSATFSLCSRLAGNEAIFLFTMHEKEIKVVTVKCFCKRCYGDTNNSRKLFRCVVINRSQTRGSFLLNFSLLIIRLKF